MAEPDLTTSSCPGCGCDLPPPIPDKTSSAYTDLSSAQARIAELESQVRRLNEKAASAITRWSEYENELLKLKSQQPTSPQSPTAARSTTSSPSTSFLQSGTSTLSSLLYPRKSNTNLRSGSNSSANPPPLRTNTDALSPTSAAEEPPSTPVASLAEDLLDALNREQTLRQEAEGRLTATSKEMEELSAALFEQANEMVADERKARAKLEERVGELEKRDWEKRQRLERWETAMTRIDRVKNLLSQ
ncbi:hypothetical protein Golomagni_07811 [Golovinomyces magnicellulatus]|nr:hypothetical protein Golomagni_07811 [Golovinomyces magnicellulatus]